MKRWSTTPVSKSFTARAVLVSCAILVAVAAPIRMGGVVSADKYDRQIETLKDQIADYKDNAEKLHDKANTLQGAIDEFNRQISTIQSQIDLAQKKRDKLVKEISINEKKIEDNKKLLGKTIASIYVNSNTSALEMIASSNSIGDYLDKQAQRQAVQDKLSNTVDRIKKLKEKLEKQKTEVDRQIMNKKNSQGLLDSKKSEKKALMDETKGKESEYKKLASEKTKKISDLREQQAEANRRAAARARNNWQFSIPSGAPGGGGYPGVWANAPLDAYVDPWGLYTRECVSYAAWKVSSTGRFVPNFGGYGNAKQWPSTTAKYGIKHGSVPKKGSVAIMMEGYYGHAMYVESVNDDGTITVSDYNLYWDGLYRVHKWPSSGLTYIYF